MIELGYLLKLFDSHALLKLIPCCKDTVWVFKKLVVYVTFTRGVHKNTCEIEKCLSAATNMRI